MSTELRPLGVRCNIGCRYCYQQPIRDAGNAGRRYDMEKMKAAVERSGGPFVLFGGEPLLLGLDDLEELLRWGFEQYGRTSVQTNGTLIGDEHLRLFRAYNVDVGISVDGPGELNDLRWQASQERTRANTARTMTAIERLCREHRPPGIIVTLHRHNATPERLPRLHAWMRELDALGVRSVRLHLLEAESDAIRAAYGLSDDDNAAALLSFAALQPELARIRFDVLDEIESSLVGRDERASCVWRACDPYTTPAVQGVEGNGQSSNCGRTNKDGVDHVKAERGGFERYLALYATPQADGGCAGCRFFLMCKGQCPGTAIDGDWRNRSELCGVWKRLFAHFEERAVARGDEPLSLDPGRAELERRLVAAWAGGRNPPLHVLRAGAAGDGGVAPAHAPAAPPPGRPRVGYVGEPQREVWAPRIAAARDALGRVAVLAAARRPGTVVIATAEPAEVLALHNLAAEHGLHARLLDAHPGGRPQRLAIGAEAPAATYARAHEAKSWATCEALAGVPACCRAAAEARRRAGQRDPAWLPAAASDPGTVPPDGVVEVEACALNPFLVPLGIDVLGHLPCTFGCTASRRLAEERIALGRQGGLAAAMDQVEAMLGWPAEWSALHGVAELKTGIVRATYATDYTAAKVTLRYRGTAPAPDAARGLTFAYRPPGRRTSLPLIARRA